MCDSSNEEVSTLNATFTKTLLKSSFFFFSLVSRGEKKTKQVIFQSQQVDIWNIFEKCHSSNLTNSYLYLPYQVGPGLVITALCCRLSTPRNIDLTRKSCLVDFVSAISQCSAAPW